MYYAQMTSFDQLLVMRFLGNTLEQYIVALGIFFLSYLLVRVFVVIIKKRLQLRIDADKQKKKKNLWTVLLTVVNNIPRYFLWLLIIYLSLNTLVLASRLQTAIDVVFVLVFSIQLIYALIEILDYTLIGLFSLQGDVSSTTENLISLSVKIVVWILGGMIILMNMGIQITPLIASLGLGGIAVAFALQNILQDVFSSFSILFDKPFKVGDFVTIGGESGTIKRISLKSTRIKTTAGQDLIMPNKKVMESNINNFAGIQKRRVKQTLGVTYETSHELLQKIPSLLEEIVKNMGNDQTKLLWAVFKDYGPYSLDFELCYYTKANKYKDHLDIVERINFAIFESFGKHHIDFAYPTQMLHVKTQQNQ